MREIGALRTLAALVLRDLGCALRTPTIVFMALVGVALCWVIAQWSGSLDPVDEDVRRFLLALDAIVPPLMGGSSVALFLLAEEREHGACAALARAGVPLGSTVVAKVLAAMAFTALVTLACLAVTAVPVDCWAPSVVAVTVASLPLLVVAAAMGTVVRTYAQTSGPCLVLVCLALPPQLATLDAALAPIAMLSPVEAGAVAVTWLASGAVPAEGWGLVAAVYAVWAAASAAFMAACLRHRARQDRDACAAQTAAQI